MSDSWTERKEQWKTEGPDARSPWDVDYARVVHSSSFRRLQGKTQILNLGDSDFYRTRLTHSLEVAQIAGSLANQLNTILESENHPAKQWIPDRAMIHAVGLIHDLGHPPFGHGGEIALHYCMRNHEGFEGNAQTLRILSKLEKMSAGAGSNLTRRSLLAIVKYPANYDAVANTEIIPSLCSSPTAIRILDRESSKPPKCYHNSENKIVDWILQCVPNEERKVFQTVKTRKGKHGKTLHQSFDCSIMDVADDIAYGVHDLEDAIALGLIQEEQFRNVVTEEKSATFLDWLAWKTKGSNQNNIYEEFIGKLFGDGNSRKRCIGRLVGFFTTSIMLDEIDTFETPLLRFRASLPDDRRNLLDVLTYAVRQFVILDASVQHLEFKGQQMVVSVFEAFSAEPNALLPNYALDAYNNADGDERTICDYIAGMTDGFLLKTYERLFSPRMGSVFDRL